MSWKRSRSRWFVLLILTGAGLGAMLLSPWQPQTRAGDTAGEPEVKVEDITILPRVPIYGNDPLGTNEKSVTVTLWPSPLPAGKTVTVQISKLSGTGGATFDDGSTSKDITQTTTLKVRGTINSSASDNMLISATCEGKGLSRSFTVSTWPYDLQNTLAADKLGFGFRVLVTWQSESGSPFDLGNVLVREYVTCPHQGTNPPFLPRETDPIITDPPIPGTNGAAQDSHFFLIEWIDWSTQTEDYRESHQQYQFRDTVLNTSWEFGILGTATITKTVAKDPDPNGTYTFTTTKTGPGAFSHTCPAEKP